MCERERDPPCGDVRERDLPCGDVCVRERERERDLPCVDVRESRHVVTSGPFSRFVPMDPDTKSDPTLATSEAIWMNRDDLTFSTNLLAISLGTSIPLLLNL